MAPSMQQRMNFTRSNFSLHFVFERNYAFESHSLLCRFSEKTGNDFDDRKNFSNIAGKYTLVDLDYGDDDDDSTVLYFIHSSSMHKLTG